MNGREEPGEVACDAAFEGRDAGADYTDVDFKGGPYRCERIVPADIVADGDGIESAEAHDGYDADDAAHAEDDHEDVALAFREVERFEDW